MKSSFTVLLLCCAVSMTGAQTEAAFSGGISYSLSLKEAGNVDIHSFDFIFTGNAAYTLKTLDVLNTSVHIGLFAGFGLFMRNPLFPEASNYIIYDTALRAGILAGPSVGLSLGRRFEPYLGTGFTLLGILVNHSETTAFQGDIRYECFEVTTGAGLMAGTMFFIRPRDQAYPLFLNLGVFTAWYFVNYTRVTSKYDDYAGFANHFVMFEIRPFLTFGLILQKEKP